MPYISTFTGWHNSTKILLTTLVQNTLSSIVTGFVTSLRDTENSQKIDELPQSRESVFKEAVEKTKRILSEEQRKKYEELLKEQEKRGLKYSRP